MGARLDTGVLLSHGFTGSPATMRPLADAFAAAGYRVRLPLLPGHGTSWSQMNHTTFDDWVAALTAELAELRAVCRTVVVCGLSMGGTLALRLAELYPDRVDGLVLINPSVMTSRWDARFAPLLNRMRPVVRRVLPSLAGIVDDVAKPGVREGGYFRIPTLAALSLQAAWPVVRADLSVIRCPMMLLHSVVDHVVEPRNAQIVLDETTALPTADKHEVLLRNSFHVATLDYDAALIEARALEFVRELSERSSPPTHAVPTDAVPTDAEPTDAGPTDAVATDAGPTTSTRDNTPRMPV
ncbi:alpha/beta hydrolase [Nakamurella aerolata]